MLPEKMENEIRSKHLQYKACLHYRKILYYNYKTIIIIDMAIVVIHTSGKIINILAVLSRGWGHR